MDVILIGDFFVCTYLILLLHSEISVIGSIERVSLDEIVMTRMSFYVLKILAYIGESSRHEF